MHLLSQATRGDACSPNPVMMPPMDGLDDVTKGYVPKSMSSMVALAPSTRMRLPLRYASSAFRDKAFVSPSSHNLRVHVFACPQHNRERHGHDAAPMQSLHAPCDGWLTQQRDRVGNVGLQPRR